MLMTNINGFTGYVKKQVSLVSMALGKRRQLGNQALVQSWTETHTPNAAKYISTGAVRNAAGS